MKDRKAFTLVELLVVIGVITILIGILLPVLNKMRRSATITSQKADFQTIASALESYKTDFGDYPRNNVLTRWNTQPGPIGLGTAPIHLTLAAALMGAGPGGTQIITSGKYEVGDGAPGLGFRDHAVNIPVTVAGAPAGTSITVNVDNNDSQALNNFVNNSDLMSLTMSSGMYNEETVGISSVNVSSGTATVGLGAAPNFANHQKTDLYVLHVFTGKIWPNYLSADTFKVAFVPTGPDINGVPFGGPNNTQSIIGAAGEPVLLDRWGQVIQYFPRYGPASNRTSDSTVLPYNTSGGDKTVTAGPLYGNSQPKSIDSLNGQNAIWDMRDGTPFLTPTTPPTIVPGQVWADVMTVAPKFFRPEFAVQWMLGDQPDPTSGAQDNVIKGAEKLSYDGPYILISAGPDGPNRGNGGFCNMADPNTGMPLPANAWQKTFNDSGNVYNFDRP